jgi:DNA primase
MLIKLAMDNDAAGYNAVWRTLEKSISTMYVPFDFDGMSDDVFEAWLPRFCYVDLLMIQAMSEGNRAEIVEQRLSDERRRIPRRRKTLLAMVGV